MSAERVVPLDNFPTPHDYLVISRERYAITHRVDGVPYQSLTVYRDPEANGAPTLGYFFCIDGMWASMQLCYTELPSFSVGRQMPDGELRGICFLRNVERPQYLRVNGAETQTYDYPWLPCLNWKQLCDRNCAGIGHTLTFICKDPATNNADFLYKLLPSAGSPVVQVSQEATFTDDQTLTLDTSYVVGTKTFRDILFRAEQIINSEDVLETQAINFCEDLQLAFCRNLPIPEIDE